MLQLKITLLTLWPVEVILKSILQGKSLSLGTNPELLADSPAGSKP